MQQYKSQYESKCLECEQLNEQFNQLQQQTNLIINDLQEELKEVKRKNQMYNREIAEIKEKRKCFNSSVEREIDLAQKERNQFKKKFVEFEKKVIELEIMNESLENELRATKSTLAEYETRIERTMEQLAFLQIQLEETTSNNQQTTARLKAQLKETQEQLYALHHGKYHKDSAERKMSKDYHENSMNNYNNANSSNVNNQQNGDQNGNQQATHQNNQLKNNGRSQSHISQSEGIIIGSSELTSTNLGIQSGSSALFKDTLKGIRQYIAVIDSRKKEIRNKMLRKIQS